jgi:hypothetical protein
MEKGQARKGSVSVAVSPKPPKTETKENLEGIAGTATATAMPGSKLVLFVLEDVSALGIKNIPVKRVSVVYIAPVAYRMGEVWKHAKENRPVKEYPVEPWILNDLFTRAYKEVGLVPIKSETRNEKGEEVFIYVFVYEAKVSLDGIDIAKDNKPKP